ncbi:MAG TPA: fatty acid hydroxylase [Candidatus Paceibacterota bacterium]
MSIALTIFSTLAFGILYASIAEWNLHKHLMHTRRRWFDYPYRKHALVHHVRYKADASYHLLDSCGDTQIPMTWWNGPALVVVGMIPVVPVASLVGHFIGDAEGWTIFWTALFTFAGYYGVYERLHWCFHAPMDRWIEGRRIFRWLNAHHLLHHQYMWKNYNVVFPFADWLFRTLLLRAPRNFPQARGSAVPDVQPI